MISIIICTHNRAHILKYCLQSFTVQSLDKFELMVVDNASTDSTAKVVESFQNHLPLRYVYEEQIGLSHARNRGWKEAKHEWISYVDDDARAYPDYVERTEWVIKNFGFDCFGGRFFPWYLEPKPNWLSPDFGLFPKLRNTVGELQPSQHAAGGIIVFRKQALQEAGGFPTNLGMKGNEVAYGEENWVQDEMRKKNFKIGFDPELKIDHLVASYKYTLRWQLKRMLAKGQTEKRMTTASQRKNGLVLFIKGCLFTFYSLGIHFRKLIGRKDYYWENYVLDCFGYLYRVIGYLK